MIAGFDTEFNRGDFSAGYGITLIPRIYVTTSYMNSTNTASGGYHGSYMHTTLLPTIATALQNVLGSHLQSRQTLLSSVINTSAASAGYSGLTGAASGWGWYSAYCTLMSEVQVYGSCIWGNAYDVGEACQKLPIFNFINHNQYGCNNFWLRAVATSTEFAGASSRGFAQNYNATDALYVRPLIYIS